MASLNRKQFRKVTRKRLTPKVIPITENQNDTLQFLNANAKGTFNSLTTDESGYGASPAAERNNTYFAYFNDVTSTEPEILDKSGIYIKYLIDKNGELTDPKPGDVALYNLQGTFEKDTKLFISPEQASQAFSPLIGSHSIENVGTVQLVLTSELGYGDQDFLSNGLKFAQYFNSKVAQAQTDFTIERYAFSSSAAHPNPILGQGGSWAMGQPASDWAPPIVFTTASDGVYVGQLGYRGWNNEYPVGNSGSSLVSFNSVTGIIDLLDSPKSYNLAPFIEAFGTVIIQGPPNTPFTFQLAAQKSLDGGATWTNMQAQDKKGFDTNSPQLDILSGINSCVSWNGNTGTANPNLGNIGSTALNVGFNTFLDMNSVASDSYRLVYRVIDVGNNQSNSNLKWFLKYAEVYEARFSLLQQYNVDLTAGYGNNKFYWRTGSIFPTNPNEYLWLTASSVMAGTSKNLEYFTNPFDPNVIKQGYVQVFDTFFDTMTSFGYSQPNIPAYPKIGDYVRFEHDKTKQTRIMDIQPYNDTYAIGLAYTNTILPGTQFNHFTISRVINDGNYVILNKFYPASGSVVGELTGFARPENLTQEIQDNFGNLTTQLVKDGVLNK